MFMLRVVNPSSLDPWLKYLYDIKQIKVNQRQNEYKQMTIVATVVACSFLKQNSSKIICEIIMQIPSFG